MPPIGSAPNGAVRPHARTRTSTLTPLPLNLVKIYIFFLSSRGRKAGANKLYCSMPGRRAGSSGFFLRDRLNHTQQADAVSNVWGAHQKQVYKSRKNMERIWSSFHPSSRGI